MIIFNGKLSSKSINYITSQLKQKKVINKLLLIYVIIVCISSVPIILLGLLAHWLCFFFEIIVLGAVFVALKILWNDMNKIPEKVVVDNINIMLYFEKGEMVIESSKIVQVLDLGSFYQLLLRGGINQNFICQKDLLVKGTLEDFENLFAGKIIRQ